MENSSKRLRNYLRTPSPINSTIHRKFVRLYALVGRLRLFAPGNVIAKAEQVMQHIVETYRLPNRDFRSLEDSQQDDVDVLRAFSEVCREDLRV